MKKGRLMLLSTLFFISLGIKAQTLFGDDYYKMIKTSISEYFKEYLYIPSYISTEGFPYDFPFDSLGLTPFNMNNMMNNSKSVLEKAKQGNGIGVLEIEQQLANDKIIFYVTKSVIKMPRKRKFEIIRGENISFSVFQFSCEESKWHHLIVADSNSNAKTVEKRDRDSQIDIKERVIIKHKQLPVLLIENEDLIPLFDKSITFFDSIKEKSDSLFFTINTNKRSEQDFYTLQISSNEHRITIFNGYEDPIGFFYYKNHLFVVYNQESEMFFSTTNSKKSFCQDPKIKDKLLVLDDSLPYWDYIYYNDKFVLYGETIPFRFRNDTDKE